jgi:hypothetical protein
VQLAAVVLARTLGYVEVYDLSPRGRVFVPDVVKGIVERYNFQRFPAKPEELDLAKGLVFEEGRIANKVIQKLSIFDTLIALETRSNTDESKQIIEEMLTWAATKFKISYAPGSIKRHAYVSGVSFYSDVPALLNVGSPLDILAAKTSTALSDIWQEPMDYQTVGIAVGHDILSRKNAIAQFTLTRRSEARFSENKYYSEAPLPTDLHIALLGEFEAGVKRTREIERDVNGR